MNLLLLIILTSLIACKSEDAPETSQCYKVIEESNHVTILFPEYFGKEFMFKCEVVASPNTYYAKNYIPEKKYRLKILSIENKILSKSYIIEPEGFDHKKYKVGQVLTLHGFERLNEIGEIKYKDKLQPKLSFQYQNLIVITKP